MAYFRFLGLIVIVGFLSACAPSAQQKADFAAVEASPVSPATYDKMVHGDALSVNDLIGLGRARVNEGVILRYERDHEVIYYLTSTDVAHLRDAGLSPSLIDYLLSTPQLYTPVIVEPVYDPFFIDPYYCGPGYYHHDHHWRH